MSSIGIDANVNKDEVVKLNNEMEADIVYENKSFAWLKFLWIIPLIFLALIVFIGSIYLTQVNIVPDNVVGSNYSAMGYSVISDSYSVNMGDISVGSKVILGDSESYTGPYLSDYNSMTVRDISNKVIYLEGSSGKTAKVSIYDILYIINR